jgi:hypothetical protein
MPDAVVFTQGVYDVVLARDARYVPQALERVRPDKRPPLADAIFRAYSEWFPDWPVALCCFNTVDRARAEPLLWWYRPRNPAVLFAPALDAHDGRPPDLREQVPVDHTVIFGSDRLAGGVRVPYGLLRDPDAEPDYWSSPEAEERVAKSSDRAAGQALLAKFREQARERRADWERQQAIRPYLPERVTGGRLGGRSLNGDFACRVADLLGGSPYIERLQPRELAGLAS